MPIDPAEAPLSSEDHERDSDQRSAEGAEEHVAVQTGRYQDIADERGGQTGQREGRAEAEEHGDLRRRLRAEQQRGEHRAEHRQRRAAEEGEGGVEPEGHEMAA